MDGKTDQATLRTISVIQDVINERVRQDEKWGGPDREGAQPRGW